MTIKSERKRRILWCGEAHFISTGYANYAVEILKRLHRSHKYELFELGCYAAQNDPRIPMSPWPFIPVTPNTNNQQEIDEYNRTPSNQWGEWKFEQACLQALPDVVTDIRDVWHFEHQGRSPYREYFNWLLMPAVDARPQEEGWISVLSEADGVFTYTDWATDVLRKQSSEELNLLGSTPPCADTNIFKPVLSKREHKQRLGVDPECYVVGMVGRNQKRKLIPELFEAFSLYCKSAPSELAKQTYLYCHTTWPDIGWKIPKLLNEFGIGHKVVFTYACKDCRFIFPTFFADGIAACKRCGHHSATMPRSDDGISRENLADIYNCFDAYIQYAICEGFGIPQLEAACCGIPVFSVDYSGMEDVLKKLKGFPIKVQRLIKESETGRLFAYPDNEAFVRQITDFLLLPEPARQRIGFETRQNANLHYNYDRVAQRWMDYFDSVPLADKWTQPGRFHSPNKNIPEGMNNNQFVNWGLVNIAGRPDLINSYYAMKMVRDLTWGVSHPQMGGMYFTESSFLGSQQRMEHFNREIAANQLLNLCERKNYWEKRRVEHVERQKKEGRLN